MKRLLSLLLTWTFVLLTKTLRIRVHGIEQFRTACEEQQSRNGPPVMLSMWHNRLFLAAYLPLYLTKSVKYTALISKSRDGDIPTLFATNFCKIDVIRIGHKKRHPALLEMIRALKNKQVVFITPDGPRGPRYEVKPGVIIASQRTQARIFPFTWKASWVATLKSWDRFKIPLPFAKVELHFHDPITFEGDEPIEACAARLQQATPFHE